jgi:hypothetical protein
LVVAPGEEIGVTERRILTLPGWKPVAFGRRLFQSVAFDLQLPGAFLKISGVTECKISQE